MIVILSTWTENYGDASENKSLLAQFRGAAVAIASGIFLTFNSVFSLLPFNINRNKEWAGHRLIPSWE
jgi:hypothetical protein